MRVAGIFHLLLPVYLFVGYITAYRLAHNKPPISKPSRIGLWSARFMMVTMVAAGLFASLTTWEAPIFPMLLGATFNLFWFYAACIRANKNYSPSPKTQHTSASI